VKDVPAQPTVTGFGQHASAIGELVASLYAAGSAVGSAAGSAAGRRADPADPGPGIADFASVLPRLDASLLTGVVSVDWPGRTALVQGGCTMARLAAVTAARGLAPLTVAAPGTITVGGAVARTAVGSSSFATGAFADCVQALQVLTPSGLMVAAERDGAEAGLFHATLGAEGATGYVAAARVALAPARPFVATRSVGFETASGLAAALEEVARERRWDGYPVDFAEAVTRGVMEHVMVLGRGVEAAEAATLAVEPSQYAGPGPSYDSTLADGARDLLSLGAYLTRWDADEFWHSADYAFRRPPWRTLWPARARTGRVYARLDALLDSPSPARELEQTARWRPGAPRVYREVVLPLNRLAEFLGKLAALIPGVPIWTCPLTTNKADDAVPTIGRPGAAGNMWAYCGIWGPGGWRKLAHNVGTENAIDREAVALGGRTVRSRA
jgi:FAD/FMN-containing dehydrogenase